MDCLLVDINECAVRPNVCRNGACENLMRGYRCLCHPGYKADKSGKQCIGSKQANDIYPLNWDSYENDHTEYVNDKKKWYANFKCFSMTNI